MAILAFSTTAGYGCNISFTLTCDNNITHTFTYPISYPFRLIDQNLLLPTDCKSLDDLNSTQRFPMDFSNSSQFFFTTGILSLLYALGILTFYLISDDLYLSNSFFPSFDLIASTLMTLFWFAGSCAWSSGLNALKLYAMPSNFIEYISICKTIGKCSPNESCSWATPNVSLVSASIFFFHNLFKHYHHLLYHPLSLFLSFSLSLLLSLTLFDIIRYLVLLMFSYGLAVYGSYLKKPSFMKSCLLRQLIPQESHRVL